MNIYKILQMGGRGENLLDDSEQSLKYYLTGYKEYSNKKKKEKAVREKLSQIMSKVKVY